MKFDSDSTAQLKVFHATFERLVMDEGGENTNCVNYPNKQFETFADCDQDFVRRQLPPDFKPFWNQEPSNLNGVTTTYDPIAQGQDPESFAVNIGKLFGVSFCSFKWLVLI